MFHKMMLISCILLICGGCASKQSMEIDKSTEGRIKVATSKILFSEDQGKGSLKCSEMKDWDIVVNSEAIPSEKHAAAEFQLYFGKATGIQLPINNNAEKAEKHVYIGAESGFAVDNSDLGDEGLRVIVKDDALAIAGGEPRGTLYGVYQFLRDGLGIRFLTVDHTHIPDAAKAEIPCGEYSYVPTFSFRWSYYKENSDRPDFAAKVQVNTVGADEKLGGKTPQNLINHSFHWLVPFSEYGEEHPEYYAVFEGKRDTNTGGGGPQLCVTNPEVIKIAAETVIQHLDKNPELRNVSVSQADTARYCHCEECEEINQREGTPMGSNLAFVNAVAELVEKKHPKVKIGTLVYWYTRQRPKTIKPRPNVQLQLCSIECCTLHPLNDPDCERNQKFCEDTDNWSAVSKDIWIWNYNTNFHMYDLPFPNLRVIGPNIRYFVKSNVKGAFMQANGNGNSGELCDLRNYLIARMLWNPELDDQEVIEEFVKLHYKGAAQVILDYINMLHDNAEQMGVNPGCFPKPAEVGLTPEVAQKTFDFFKKAMELADDETVKARVEKASICSYRAMLEAGELEDSERKALIDDYIELCHRHNMTRASEHKDAETFFKELKE